VNIWRGGTHKLHRNHYIYKTTGYIVSVPFLLKSHCYNSVFFTKTMKIF